MYSVFNAQQRRQFLFVLFLLLTQSFLEVFGLALILPLLYVAQYPESIETNQYLNIVFKSLGFASSDYFTVFLAVMLMVVFILKGIYSIYVIKVQTEFSHNVSHYLIDRQVEKSFGMDYLSFKKNNSNSTVQDIVTIPIEFASLVVQPLLLLTSELLVSSIIAIGIAMFNFKVFIALVVVLIPPIVIFYRSTRKRIVRLGKEKNSYRPEAYKHVFGAVHGIESVKITHAEYYFKKQILTSFKKLFNKMGKLIVIENIPIRVIEFTAISAVCLIVVYSVFFKGSSETFLSLLVVFATAAYRLMPSLNRIVSNSVRLRGSSYVFDRLKAFSEIPVIESENFQSQKNLPFKESIELKKVSFHYPDEEKLVLNEIDLRIEKGQFLGIVGKSGQGKSTLLKIFLKLFEPISGSLQCDSKVVTPEYNRAWQAKIGYVQQSVYLLDGTIEENIAFGKSEIDEELVAKCLHAASLTSFMEALQHGQKSQVGEFGNSISGGQRQRLAIARALYKEVDILVLDEATSALDSDTEAAIMKTLEKLKSKGLTVIVVAHRLSSLYACDRIIEIGAGQIQKEWSYAELINAQ